MTRTSPAIQKALPPAGKKAAAIVIGLVIACALPFVVQRLATVPMGKYVLPRDIAESVLFLSSGESRMITGQTLVIDGGFML